MRAINRREFRSFSRQNPDFVLWAKQTPEVKTWLKESKGDFQILVDEWEKTKLPSVKRKQTVKAVADSVKDVQQFVQQVQTFISQDKQIHERVKTLKS